MPTFFWSVKIINNKLLNKRWLSLMSLSNLKEAGVDATVSAVLVLIGVTFASANTTAFPPTVVFFGVILIAVGLALGVRAAYFTFLYYRNGEF